MSLRTIALVALLAAVSGKKIVGGEEAEKYQYKFMVGYRQSESGGAFCGGSLVAPEYVITAAHCAGYGNWVAIGTHYRTGTQDGERMEVAETIVHPEYNRQTLDNDIAILKLSKPSTMPTVALAADAKAYIGQTSRAIGWGATSAGGSGSDVLLQVDMELISNEQCQKEYDDIDFGVALTPQMICAGGEKGKDSCQGDSGGPLIIDGPVPVLVGATSFGPTCAIGAPGAYARMSTLREFIDEHVVGHVWTGKDSPSPSPVPVVYTMKKGFMFGLGYGYAKDKSGLTPEEAQKVCDQDAKCVAFSIRKHGGYVYFYSKSKDAVAVPGYVTYYKPQ